MSAVNCLVVDDNRVEGMILASILADGFTDAQILVVQEGSEAIRACLSDRIDCALIDYNMAQMNGLQLGERVRAEFPYLPMILMTAVGDEMLAAEALRNGFSDYIPKSKISRENIARLVRRAVQTMEQARVIDEQRSELEHFAYALAHDFKQPIRQIRTFVELLGGELDVKAETSAALHMRFLNDASRRLGALVDVMSQYTLLNKAPERSVIDPGAAAKNAAANLAAFIAERKGVFEVEATELVLGNEALLTQVLQNLVANGLLYNESERPRVTLRVEPRSDGKRLRLVLSDNGIGIEERYLKEIFKPLMRLHAGSRFPGSGLGLTIARKAVTALGGELYCVSRVGEGSQFIVELDRPAARGEVKDAA